MHFGAYSASCGFVFDTENYDKLPARCDQRKQFIRRYIAELKQALETMAEGRYRASEVVNIKR